MKNPCKSKDLKAGMTLQSPSWNQTYTLKERKPDNTGWRLEESGGFADFVLDENYVWTIVSQPEPKIEDLLTQDEHDFMVVSAELAEILRKIIGDSSLAAMDWAEAAAHIHILQRMVMSQAAARAFPDQYRLLGQTLPQ